MTKRILVIDDDVMLCELIERFLESSSYIVDMVHDGEGGVEKALQVNYSVIILDLTLPKISGFNVLKQIRKTKDTPIIILSARVDEIDKITGLKSGADDYLTKPFSMVELVARIEAMVRRYTLFNNSDKSVYKSIEFSNIFFDGDIRELYINERKIDLTTKEFELLHYMALHPGRVMSKRQLYEYLYGESISFDDNNFMSFISKIRKKIGSADEQGMVLDTVRGLGYRLIIEDLR